MSLDAPYDLEAEEAVLGAVLYQPDVLTSVAPLVQVDDFYLEKHRTIYTAMLDCATARTPADPRLVGARLKERQALDVSGGYAYLAHLTAEAPIASHAEHYARVVAGHGTRRRLIDAGGKIAALGYATGRPIDEVLAEATAHLSVTQRRTTDGLVSLRRVVDELYETMQAGAPRSVRTGLDRLDDLIGGLCPGDLTIIAGRPGHGKSSLALTIADTLARGGQTVAYFTLEMRRDELAQRLVAMRSGVSASTQRQQSYTDHEIAAVYGALGDIAGLPLALYDQRGVSIADLRARAVRYAQAVGGLALIVVDYLTLVEAHIGRGMNRAQAVGEISRGLKRLAGEADCPVVALAQLNRAIDGRTDNEPELSDLRESGDIEADADQVIFVVRPELYESDPRRAEAVRGIAKLYVKKNRHGETGIAVVQFDGVRTTLRNLAPQFRTPEGY